MAGPGLHPMREGISIHLFIKCRHAPTPLPEPPLRCASHGEDATRGWRCTLEQRNSGSGFHMAECFDKACGKNFVLQTETSDGQRIYGIYATLA